MGRQKKSELDAILEQLKKSYAADSDNDLEDPIFESEKSEEDTELAAVLEKIFSENDSVAATADSSLENISVEINKEEPVAVEEKDVVLEAEHFKSEEEKVDDVFKLMFGANVTEQDQNAETSNEALFEDLPIDEKVTESDVAEQVNQCDKCDIDSDDIALVGNETIADDEDIYDDLIYSSEEQNSIPMDAFIDELQVAYDEENNDDTVTCEIISTKITDPDKYIYDELQHTLLNVSLYKPERDLPSFVRENDKNESEESTEQPIIVEAKKEMTDNDLSLLMKFGYNGEITESGENQHAHKVIFAKSKAYIPEKHKIVHGFTGKEFSSKDQIPSIRKKYKNEKIFLLIQAIISSVIAIAALISDIAFPFSATENEFLSTAYVISILVVIALLFKKIYTGIWAVLKFDTNEYSIPSVILAEYVILGMITNIISSQNPSDYGNGVFIRIGGYVLLSLALTVWGEWIDCVRESAVFNFINDKGVHYVAQKRAQGDDLHTENKRRHSGKHGEYENRYIIKRSEFISGYHYKSVEGNAEKINTVLVIGILPAIAVTAGVISIILNESFIDGINCSAILLAMGLPATTAISLSAINFINHKQYGKYNAVCVGAHSANDISKTKSIVFDDIDAVEIISCTEINPDKQSDHSKKWVNMAHRVFEALGGPLSTAVVNNGSPESNISHDVAINSISDNGIDLYFDSSMNILIGDRLYMLSHNIKVKTDVNLTGAVKGIDRTVIYMAFDRTPQIGFIVTSKIKKSFTEAVDLLIKNDIKAEVRSYEPEINENFFEVNSTDASITVVKPSNYEQIDSAGVSDSHLVAADPLDLCRAIIYSKTVAQDQLKLRKIRKLQTIIGFATAVALVALSCFSSSSEVVKILKQYVPMFFYASVLIIAVPNIVQLLKIIIRKKKINYHE